MPKKLLNFFMVIMFCHVCVGCSPDNRPTDLPKLYPVTLNIMLDDQPIENALVFLFTEDEAIAKWTVSSVTDAEGKAVIVTHGQFRGAPAGKFKVCVKKAEAALGPGGSPRLIHHIDPQFGEQDTTTLEIEVPASRKMTNLTLNVHKPR